MMMMMMMMMMTIMIMIMNETFYSVTSYPYRGSLAALYNDIKT